MEHISDPQIESDDEDDEFFARSQRKRKLLAAAMWRHRFVVSLQLMGGQGPRGKKKRPVQQTFCWRTHLMRLTATEFKARYRLDIDAFYDLLQIIKPCLEIKNEKMARLAKWGDLVLPEVELAMALRFMAGGSPLDLKLIYGIESKSYVYDCVWLVVDACNKKLAVEFPLHDVEKLKILEAEFRAQSIGGVWEGQVGAVDGVHFPMIAPTSKDVPNPMKYYVDRKSEYPTHK